MKKMNKKTKILFFILFSIFILNVDVVRAQERNLSEIVKSEYSKEKELFIWGANHSGNLGNDSFEDVAEENKIKVNDLIDNQKIIDYAITDSQTYVLTDNNKVYASGFNIGNGNLLSKTSTFTEIKFYRQDIYIINDMNIFTNNKDNCLNNIGHDDKCTTEIKFYTNNKNVSHTLYHAYHIVTTPAIADWYKFFSHYDLKNSKITNLYPVYKDTRLENKKIYAFVDNKGYLVEKHIVDKKNRKYDLYSYKLGKIEESRKSSNYKDIVRKYKDGTLTSKRIKYYKLHTDNYREKRKDILYSYKDNKIVKRVVRKANSKSGRNEYDPRGEKKLPLYSVKEYHRNSKNELKSNRNGKAFAYINYYKKGEIIALHIQIYDSKGNISKTIKFDIGNKIHMINAKLQVKNN